MARRSLKLEPRSHKPETAVGFGPAQPRSKYIKVNLGGGKTRDLHRLIMEKYLGRTLLRHEAVHHINGDPKDNRLANLRVMSLSAHARLHRIGNKGYPISERGRQKLSALNTGEGHPQSKLTADIVKYIRESRLTNKELSAQLKVSGPIISQVRTGKRWTHVHWPIAA